MEQKPKTTKTWKIASRMTKHSSDELLHAASLLLCCSYCILFLATLSQGTEATPARQVALGGGNQFGDGDAPSLPARFRRQSSLGAVTEESELMKRQSLPDLIAQAHNDKLAERALLKLIIDASLHSGLSNIVASQRELGREQKEQQQQQQVASPLAVARFFSTSGAGSGSGSGSRSMEQASNGGWQRLDSSLADEGSLPMGELTDAQLQQATAFGHLARLEAALANEQLANLEAYNSNLSQQPNVMDKREYIKPCSFNAISCVRTPFRKL